MLRFRDVLDCGAPETRGIELRLKELHRVEGSRLGELPRDIVRYLIAPMVLSPYSIVTIDGDTNMVLTNGTDCFCRGFYLAMAVVVCGRTQAGWATIDKWTNLRYHGLMGSYGGVRWISHESFIGQFLVSPTWTEDDLLLEIRTLHIYPASQAPYVPERRINLPGPCRRIAHYEEDHLSNYDVDVTLLLWDGARELLLYRQRDGNIEVRRETLPWAAAAVSGRLGEYVVLYPWGEFRRVLE